MGILGIVGTAAEGNLGFGRYHQKLVNQFSVEIYPSFGSDTEIGQLLTENVRRSLASTVKTFARPNIDITAIEIKHGNESWKTVGRTSWSTDSIEGVWRDAIPQAEGGSGDSEPLYSASAIFYEWQNLCQNIATGAQGLARDYKANIVVTQYNPAGEEVEKYLYHGAWPKTINGSGWDMEGENGNEVSVSFSVDKIYRIAVGAGNNTPPEEIIGIADEE